MKKRILSLAVILTLLVSMLTVFNVFADTYTQRVALKSYQPAVKTLIVDDDFNDLKVTGEAHGIKNEDRSASSEYNAIWIGNGDGYTVSEGNNAVSFASAWQQIQINKTSNSDKLVVSFDMYNTSATALGFRFVNKNYTTDSKYAVLLNGWAANGTLTNNGTSIAKNLLTSSLASKWVNVTMVFERVLNSAGTGYEASLKSFYLDGVLYDASNVTPTSNIDWWTKTENMNFYIQNCSPDTMYDNLLIYVPEESLATGTPIPSYVPAAKNILIDDNFESSTLSGTSLSSTKSNSFSTIYNVGQLGETAGNHYPVTNTWAKFYPKNTTGLPNAERLIMTFKIKAPETLTNATSYLAGFNIQINTRFSL